MRFLTAARPHVIAGVVASIVAAGIVLLIPSRYESTALITASSPDVDKASGSLMGLAAKFGLGGAAGGGNLDQLATLIKSRDVLDSVSLASYPKDSWASFHPDGCAPAANECTLVSILGLGRDTRADSLEQAAKVLASRVSVDVGSRDGVVSLNVSARTPALAALIATNVLRSVDALKRRIQRAQANAQLAFVESRLNEASAELARREAELAAFDQENRIVQGSPALLARRAQLERGSRMAEQVYVQLRGSVDDAILAQASDLSTIAVLQAPTVPSRRSFPKRVLTVLAAFVVGMCLSLALANARSVSALLRRLLMDAPQGTLVEAGAAAPARGLKIERETAATG